MFSNHFSGGSVVEICSESAASLQISPWSWVAKHGGVSLECTLDWLTAVVDLVDSSPLLLTDDNN